MFVTLQETFERVRGNAKLMRPYNNGCSFRLSPAIMCNCFNITVMALAFTSSLQKVPVNVCTFPYASLGLSTRVAPRIVILREVSSNIAKIYELHPAKSSCPKVLHLLYWNSLCVQDVASHVSAKKCSLGSPGSPSYHKDPSYTVNTTNNRLYLINRL